MGQVKQIYISINNLLTRSVYINVKLKGELLDCQKGR
jgi:hypothetical protein